MNRKEKIKLEVEKTLKQFDDVKPLEPNPFLYTRIQQRLNEQNKSKFDIVGILKPALFTLLFSINIVTVYWYTNSVESVSSTSDSLSEVFSEDFNLDNNNSDLLIVE